MANEKTMSPKGMAREESRFMGRPLKLIQSSAIRADNHEVTTLLMDGTGEDGKYDNLLRMAVWVDGRPSWSTTISQKVNLDHPAWGGAAR